MTTNSDNFNLSTWKLTIPADSLGGIVGTALEIVNLTGYESQYFYDAPDGAMVFRASVDGATTKGSSYPRSELREMNGTKGAAWNLALGGTMTATLKVDAVPTYNYGATGRVIVGQIHGVDNELIRLYWDKNTVYFVNDLAGATNKETTFHFKNALGEAPQIDLGEKFSYKIDAHGSTLSVSIYADGDVYTSVTQINSIWQSDTLYFKAGLYMGVNETSGTGMGQVSFYGLDFGHTEGSGLGGLPPPPKPTLPEILVATHEGGTGNDTLKGSDKDDTMLGNAGNDTIKGGNGNDIIIGGDGNDKLYGDAGDDVLYGGAGQDRLYGGEGHDIFLFTEMPDIQDLINDFDPTQDKIDIQALLGDVGVASVKETSPGHFGLYVDPDGAGAAKATLVASVDVMINDAMLKTILV